MSTTTQQERALPPGAMVTKPPQLYGTVGVVTRMERRERRSFPLSGEPMFVLGIRCYTPDDEVREDMVVELRGLDAEGMVAIGDWIQFPQNWQPGEPVPAITNLTTGRTVNLRIDSWRSIVWALATMLVGAAAVAWIAIANL